jgi:5-methylcytosine-specific restriction endonuclease McrA
VVRSREEYNEYMRQYMKNWYDRRHAQAIEQLGGKCARCGTTENLQFDHVDPATKTMDIAKMWTASEERFQKELAKCQLLCEECHKKKTLIDKGQKPAKGTHGTLSAYKYCGPPKCEECRAVKREYMQSYERPSRSRS